MSSKVLRGEFEARWRLGLEGATENLKNKGKNELKEFLGFIY